MSWYAFGLFLHLTALVTAFWFGMLIHAGVTRLWRAGSSGEARAASRMIAEGGQAMPWIGLALLLTGAYLTQAGWSWTRPWIILSILGLFVVEGIGGTAGKRLRALATRLPADGAVPADFAAAVRAPFLRAAHYLPTMLVLGVMLIMVMKPGYAAGLAILVVAAIVGAVAGLRSAPAAALGAVGADLH